MQSKYEFDFSYHNSLSLKERNQLTNKKICKVKGEI